MNRIDGPRLAGLLTSLALSTPAPAQPPRVLGETPTTGGDRAPFTTSSPEHAAPVPYPGADTESAPGISESLFHDTCPWLCGGERATKQFARRSLHLVCEDCKNFYSWPNLGIIGLELAVAAPLANTTADQHIQRWYQCNVRSSGTDGAAAVAKQFGEHFYTVPIYIGAAALGRLAADTRPGPVVEEWGCRSLRAMIVGAPAIGVLQVALGSARPDQGSSSWRPFHGSTGVSGHAFVGAVPFLTAASMTDQLWLQAPLVAASTFTTWSRVNDGAHYTSQAILGWCIGCSAVLSVNATERQRAVRVIPSGPSGEPGVSMEIRY